MKNKKILVILSLIVLVIAFVVSTDLLSRGKLPNSYGEVFFKQPNPLEMGYKLFDVGITDVNSDGLLDVYTSNHNFRQALLIADGKGGYRDVLDDWALNQSQEFPGLEISYTAPRVDKAGLYIYWLGQGGDEKSGHHVVIRAHQIKGIGQWQGVLQIHAKVEIAENEGFHVDIERPSSAGSGTVVTFSSAQDGVLALKLKTWGLPIDIDLQGEIRPTDVYVGNQNVSPRSTSFSLALQDRHGLAWADYNDDGRLDVFANRGAVGGRLKQYPEGVGNRIKDQFFVSRDDGRYQDLASEVGIAKEDCSGRHVRWVDFNSDGLLDLFVNCLDRGNVEGEYPKQLYRQDVTNRYIDVAAETGLDLLDQQVIDFAWSDTDHDGDVDLLTSEDTGFYLYRNQGGRFLREFVYRGKFSRADVPKLKFNANDYWQFDGKIVLSDYDTDGDMDVFSASKKGNAILVNEGGTYKSIDPQSVGLPPESVAAAWVDYDNDGRPDLHAVPEGLFRQNENHTFDATGLLALPSNRYQAAIINWFDRDNDGSLDVLMALSENPSLWSWWEKIYRPRADRLKWDLLTYRNRGAKNHWLQLNLVGSAGNRQAIGARVTVATPDGPHTQEVGGSEGAFFSHGHYRLYFGLGSHSTIESIAIRWPEGDEQALTGVTGNTLVSILRNEKR